MVLEYNNAITDEDCQILIDAAQINLTKAETLGTNIDGYRIAESTWLNSNRESSKRILNIISELTELPVSNMESIQIVKYGIGGQYKLHHDFFHESEDYAENILKNGGNRVKTALIYLNDDFEGGATEFPELNHIVTPAKGKIVIWDNMTTNNELDYNSIHAGLPVTSGTKYIAVVFIRKEKFV
jgi:prolyl 4-hydroxylase